MMTTCSSAATCSNPAATFPQRRPLARAVALVFALGGSAQAAVINVNSAADPVNNDGNCTLREAIQAANTDSAVDTCAAGGGADMITFNPGLGQITLTSGQIDITEELIIQGPAAGQVIDGNANGRIFAVTVADVPLTLENLTLQNGATTANGVFPDTCAADTGEGGAVCTLGDLTMENSTVSNSSTTGDDASGGGLFVDGNATLTNSTVSGNSTSGYSADGGGLFAFTATLTNSTVSGNSTSGDNANGGGIFARTATLTNSTVSGNSTSGDLFADGGGIDAFTATLTDSTVSGNSTSGDNADGGGIYARTATLTNSTVSGNSTSGDNAYGGGIFARTATLTNSTVSGNSTSGEFAYGGGLAVFFNDATLTNSTVSGNSTSGYNAGGGGLFINNGNATLTNSTVSGNSTSGDDAYGGGLFKLFGNATLNSTILANNTSTHDGGASDCYSSGTDATGSNNLIESAAFACGLTDSGGVAPFNIVGDDPNLADLADNGCAVPAGAPGSTACVQTHALIAGSPAIDTGSNPENLDFDQRGDGFNREVPTGSPDIGAFEFGAGSPSPIPVLGGWGLLALISGLAGLLGWRSSPRRRVDR